ncbi:MAG: hypothetical protein M1380_02095 [Chloroflexi bacterium]|nr:hypothetical protein [Chloroflexota bacterium]
MIAGQGKAELEPLMAQNGPLSIKRRIDVELDKLWRLRGASFARGKPNLV